MQSHSQGHGPHHAQHGPIGWHKRHQAVKQAGGWRQLLKEPIDKKSWDHPFEREISSESLLSKSFLLTPGVLPDLQAVGRQTPPQSIDPHRRRMVATVAEQQHLLFEAICKAWTAQHTWLIKLQMSDIRDIQAELASRMTAAGNWPEKELLEWSAKKNRAMDSLEDARLAGERQFAEVRLALQLAQSELEFTNARLQRPTLWTLGIAQSDPESLSERARRAVQKAPGPLGPPLDLWRSYQGTHLAFEQVKSAHRSLERASEHADLATRLLSEAVLKYNGMFISTFELLDHQIEKLEAERDVVQSTSALLQRQSASQRASLQTLFLEIDFGVRS